MRFGKKSSRIFVFLALVGGIFLTSSFPRAHAIKYSVEDAFVSFSNVFIPGTSCPQAARGWVSLCGNVKTTKILSELTETGDHFSSSGDVVEGATIAVYVGKNNSGELTNLVNRGVTNSQGNFAISIPRVSEPVYLAVFGDGRLLDSYIINDTNVDFIDFNLEIPVSSAKLLPVDPPTDLNHVVRGGFLSCLKGEVDGQYTGFSVDGRVNSTIGIGGDDGGYNALQLIPLLGKNLIVEDQEGRIGDKVNFDLNSIATAVWAVIGAPGNHEPAPGNLEENPLPTCKDVACALEGVPPDELNCGDANSHTRSNIGLNLMSPGSDDEICAAADPTTPVCTEPGGREKTLGEFIKETEEPGSTSALPTWYCYNLLNSSSSFGMGTSVEGDSYKSEGPFFKGGIANLPTSKSGNFSTAKASALTSSFMLGDFDNPAAVISHPGDVFGIEPPSPDPVQETENSDLNLVRGSYARLGLSDALCTCPEGQSGEECRENPLNNFGGEGDDRHAAYKYRAETFWGGLTALFSSLFDKHFDKFVTDVFSYFDQGDVIGDVRHDLRASISLSDLPGAEITAGVKNLALALSGPLDAVYDVKTAYNFDVTATGEKDSGGLGNDLVTEGPVGAPVYSGMLLSTVASPSGFKSNTPLIRPDFYDANITITNFGSSLGVDCDPNILAPSGHNVKPLESLISAIQATGYRNQVIYENVRECYGHLISRAVETGNDPAFVMAIWIEESGASNYDLASQVDDFGITTSSKVCPGTKNAVSSENFSTQLECFLTYQELFNRAGGSAVACRALQGSPNEMDILEFMQMYACGDVICEEGSFDFSCLRAGDEVYWPDQIGLFYSVAHKDSKGIDTNKVIPTSDWSR